MLRHKRNSNSNQTHSEHVKLPKYLDALHPQSRPHPHSLAFRYITPVLALRNRLQFNQHLNQRTTLCLELYHKNIIKKLSELKKINVYKLSKNVCQT